MRPQQFQPQPSQGNMDRMPPNPQMMLQNQQQQQRMMHQQPQGSGLNAAIRDMQQKSPQNQRHPLNAQWNQNRFPPPAPFPGPRMPPNNQNSVFQPHQNAGNFNQPPMQNRFSARPFVPHNPSMRPPSNQNSTFQSNNSAGNLSSSSQPLLRERYPASPYGPSSANNQVTASTQHPSGSRGRAQSSYRTSPDRLSRNRSPEFQAAGNRYPYNSRVYDSKGDERDSSRREGERSNSDISARDKGQFKRSSDRNDRYSDKDRPRYENERYPRSSEGRDHPRVRERSRDRIRSDDREKRPDHRRRDRERDSKRTYPDSKDEKDKSLESFKSSEFDSSKSRKPGERDKTSDKGYYARDDSRRGRKRSLSRERSYQGSREGRRPQGYSDSKDKDQGSRRREGEYSSRPRKDRGGHSKSPKKRREDAMGVSQYRQDMMKAEFAKGMREDRLLDDFPEQEDSESEQMPAGEEMDNTVYTTRSCPADRFFTRNHESGNMEATRKMVELEKKFEEEIVKQSEKVVAAMTDIELPPSPKPHDHGHHHHHHHHAHGCKGEGVSSCESSSEEEGEDNDDDDDNDDGATNHLMEEWERRKKHPLCLHPELWYNEKGLVNDGHLCRCSIKSRKSGIRHDIYPGEKPIPECCMSSNNSDRLHHYRVTMSPYTNFLTKTPTLIEYDDHEYIFEGFSLFTHTPLENIPPCKLLRFNIEYTIHFIPEAPPENFTINSLNLFSDYLFHEVLELLDLDWGNKDGGCRRFHFMPRFCRSLPDSGCKEVLSMNTVLNFLIKSSKPLVDDSKLKKLATCPDEQWRSEVGAVRGMIVTKPGMKPSSLRIDQLDRSMGKSSGSPSSGERKSGQSPPSDGGLQYPLIIHQGYRPAQLSYAGDPLYKREWKQYVKFRHLLNSKPKLFPKDKQRLKEQEDKLQEICIKKTMKREVTVELSAKGFLCTGLRADLCQHALMIPVLMSYLRFHICLGVMEEQIDYKFKDRTLLQLALTHTSYRTNYGTNPDHTRNSLTNCGMRQLEYGDRKVHYQNTRKRGICILLDIMSRFGKQEETISEIPHNERLEFLGDAVIEFLTSVHLFFMFPWLEEGGLSTYRMALVQNQHLAQLARKLRLQDFMLYVHGPDLCQESDLRHAMANCCEALMAALFLDGGMEVVDSVFAKTLFEEESVLLTTWTDRPQHVLQQAEPGGDRHWVKSVPVLQKLEKFEKRIGVKFNHIRLLAKAFTHRNIGENPLTMGHNQRLEFLGDTVLQLVASEYLYRHYPEHHEGHLSLLRSSLVNSRTQALVYNDIGMSDFVIFNEDALTDGLDMKTKQRADMLEAFMGALFVDKGLDYCWAFCNACFFPRLKDFILNQDWNDPKSQLQQCCLTLREVGGGEPDIPIYKVIESIGPTNTRKYVVAVYFRGRRLATGSGHSIQQSEMAAATNALKKQAELFPILQHQRRFLEKMKQIQIQSQSQGQA